jgi:hypothetical protein
LAHFLRLDFFQEEDVVYDAVFEAAVLEDAGVFVLWVVIFVGGLFDDGKCLVVVAWLDERSHPFSDQFERSDLIALLIQKLPLFEEVGSEPGPNKSQQSAVSETAKKRMLREGLAMDAVRDSGFQAERQGIDELL